MPADNSCFTLLDSLLAEANKEIDTLLRSQNNPKQALELAREIKEKAREFFGICCQKYYRLMGAASDPENP